MESQIIKIIKENDNWEQVIQALGIKIKRDENLAIFNYGIGCDFSNPIVKEARGIIIDIDKLEACGIGFNKFFNVQETFADPIDWENCRVEDKIDGSIVKLWYREGYGWWWSTNSCISASEAPVQGSSRTYLDVIKSAYNIKDIDFNNLKTEYTYIFELVSPETQVVIHYPVTKLYHIGTRNNKTGEEYRMNIGIEQPKIYDIHTLDDCIEAAEKLNDIDGVVKKEGFVVVDKYWHRVKIKSPRYLQLHHVWNNGNVSKEKMIKLLMDYDAHELECDDLLQFSMLLKYYDFRLKELEYYLATYIDYVRGLYEEFNHDRRAVANTIKHDKFASFGFASIGNDKTARKLLLDTNITAICNFISDYVYLK